MKINDIVYRKYLQANEVYLACMSIQLLTVSFAKNLRSNWSDWKVMDPFRCHVLHSSTVLYACFSKIFHIFK